MTDLQYKQRRLRSNLPVVLMMERAAKRLNYAIVAYNETALADETVDMNLTQAIETLRKIRQDLKLERV